MTQDILKVGDRTFNSRLFVGTGKFSSDDLTRKAIISSGTELVTVALKRVDPAFGTHDHLIEAISAPGVQILPNTSGAQDAEEAIFAARLAREALGTNLLKLEIHPDQRHLLPDPFETLKATEILVKEGFVVMPYIQADPILCKRLEEVGAAVVMPLGAPIGTNLGLSTKELIKIIIEQSNVPVVVDAGIGAPSQAAEAMEMGADAVLVNTAIATASDPEKMAEAFRLAVEAGRKAYLSGLPVVGRTASATSPLQGFFD